MAIQRRIRKIGTVAFVIVGLMVLAGCTVATAPSEGPAAGDGKPKYGGVLTEAETLSLDQVHIDAHLSRGSPAISVHGNIHGYVMAEDMLNRGTVIGDLATSWNASSDGLSYTFKIREGVQTHKGKPFSAEDVAYNLNRMIETPNKINMFRTGCMKALAKEAKAPDKTTVVVTLHDRSAAFLACMAGPHMYIQPKYILEEIDGPGKGRLMLPEEIDGVGPFQYVKAVPDNVWEVTRNPNFFKEGLPYLDGIRFVNLADPSSIIAAFRTQRIDMFQKFATTPRPSEVEALRKEFGDQITIVPGVAPSGPPFQLNYKQAPLNDIRIREAIDLTFNRQQENELLKEGAATWGGPYYCGWGTIFTCEELLTWPGHRPDKTEDLQRAKELMRQAGFNPDQPGALTLTAVCGTGETDGCALLKEDLSKIGITLRLQRMESSARVDTSNKGGYDITVAGRITAADDPEDYNGQFYLPTGAVNHVKWEHPKFLELYQQQRQELNPEKRFQTLREMAKIIYNDHVSLHGYNDVLNPGFWNYVKGYTPPTAKKPHQTTYRMDTTWMDVDSPIRRQ